MITREKFKNDILDFIKDSNGLRYSEFDEISKHSPKECPKLFEIFSMKEILNEIIREDLVVVVEYRIPRGNDKWYDDLLLLPKGSRVTSIEDAVESYAEQFDCRDSYPGEDD